MTNGPKDEMDTRARSFYERMYSSDTYATPMQQGGRYFEIELRNFIKDYVLETKRVLEIGSGRGVFQEFAG